MVDSVVVSVVATLMPTPRLRVPPLRPPPGIKVGPACPAQASTPPPRDSATANPERALHPFHPAARADTEPLVQRGETPERLSVL